MPDSPDAPLPAPEKKSLHDNLQFIQKAASEKKIPEDVGKLQADNKREVINEAVDAAFDVRTDLLSGQIEGQTQTYGERLAQLKAQNIALVKLNPDSTEEDMAEALIKAAKTIEQDMKDKGLEPELLQYDPISSLEIISPENPAEPTSREDAASAIKAKLSAESDQGSDHSSEALAQQDTAAADAATAGALEDTQDQQPPADPQKVLEALAKGPTAVTELAESV